jgi:hypothetical protein
MQLETGVRIGDAPNSLMMDGRVAHAPRGKGRLCAKYTKIDIAGTRRERNPRQWLRMRLAGVNRYLS